jgi:hypothetical protein
VAKTKKLCKENNMLTGEVIVIGDNFIEIELDHLNPKEVIVRFEEFVVVPCNAPVRDSGTDSLCHKIKRHLAKNKYILFIEWDVCDTRVVKWKCYY